MPSDGWALLLAQLPASPSSPRVTLWRRARAAGAVGLQNGAWVLPGTREHREFFEGLAEYVREHGGTAYALEVTDRDDRAGGDIVARFRAERAKEFAEFEERGRALLAELEKETARDNFSFAELEENEQGLDRLAAWFTKISARDFFPDERLKEAEELLDRCRRALEAFTAGVYQAEGVAPDVPPSAG
ncbi:chromate resistance protein ChrB [Pseudonocardia sp. C8]|uniref:Chromate resistance protein ChrB n=1 Tax=Pseudonocardia sp. C8 TaxID=2762759 RepID=UPI001642F4A2|nr:Chromate resistance protein ChrB [Pseudonocardia sp. C8]MBC3194714.1 chromate resistance protein ChrB [Pseudonocardia sp. C8]